MFQGFSQATGDFIWSLAMNNDRTWFAAHKAEFEAHLNQPFRALAADTLARLQARHPDEDFQLHVSRIYRDARRLFGRGPFKDRLWFTIQPGTTHPEGPLFWFELDGVSHSYGMGSWDSAPDEAAAFRAAIDADPARFRRLVEDIPGDCRLWGEEYKRPKGDRGATINPWYNRKHVSVGYERGFGGDLYSPALPDIVAEAFEGLTPMYRFFREIRRAVERERAAQRDLALSQRD